MSRRREDTGSRTPDDAARYERKRALEDDPLWESLVDEWFRPTKKRRCTCNTRSMEPCPSCQEDL